MSKRGRFSTSKVSNSELNKAEKAVEGVGRRVTVWSVCSPAERKECLHLNFCSEELA